MSNIDKQAVQAVADLKAGYTLGNADVAILNELARIALASLEAKPVAAAYVINGVIEADDFASYCGHPKFQDGPIELYAAPPSPVSVPDEMYWQNAPVEGSTRAAAYATGWNACRAAMLQGAEPVSQPCTLPDGYCVMPLKLTYENGAKGALSGEFHVTNRVVCQSCAGEGCEDCNDEGGWDAEIPVSWDTIKRIHEAAVEACSLPAAPQQEVKS